jgi:hypothetical protein
MLKLRQYLLPIYTVVGIVLIIIFYPLFEVGGKKKSFARGRAFFGSNYFVLDRQLGWKLRPSIEVRSKKGGTLFKTDPFGFRNPESKLPDHGKAILVGGAAVQGYFLSSSESLSEQLSSKIGGYVYNFGVGGYSLDQEYVVAEAALSKFKTDWLVLVLSLYDLPFLGKDHAWGFKKPHFEEKMGQVQWDHYVAVLTNPDRGPVFSPKQISLYGVSSFDSGSYLTDRWDLYKESLLHFLSPWKPRPFSIRPGFKMGRLKGGDESYTQDAVYRRDFDMVFQYLEKMNALSKSKGVRFIVYFLPEGAQVVSEAEPYFAPQRVFQRGCSAKKDLHCVEPHADYMKAQTQGDLFFRDDGNLSPRGSAYTAEHLASEMH